MTTRDPELSAILVQELARRLAMLEAAPGVEAATQTVHALKGSAGLAGETELSHAMQRLERRLLEGDGSALADTLATVRLAIERLAAGERATRARWPVPPDDLAPRTIDPSFRPQYVAEIADRLARVDEALAHAGPDVASELRRHVHTLKGAASAVEDEPMAWFCHGLEERIRGDGVAVVEEIATWRTVLGLLLDAPEDALSLLRGQPLGRTTLVPDRHDDDTIRVSAHDVDRLLDHAAGIVVGRERFAARVAGSAEHARELRRLRSDLAEALRLIGPPRPWGAPAAALQRIARTAETLAEMSERFDVLSERLKASDLALKDDTIATRRILGTMRQTPIRGMFVRLAAAAHAEARRTGRRVRVQTTGADEAVDRRLVELLMEPCMQLARNAIAHGIEDPDTRDALGKPGEAVLTLSARRRGNRLSVTIADDGAGVDVAALRLRAVESGVVTEVLAEAADDQTLLELLFLPGFSTRSQSPDLLAGRGIGLDITLASVQRLGGTIRLASHFGRGFEARIDIPIETGLATVLWLEAEGVLLAVPAANVRRLRRPRGAELPAHLAACLEPRNVGRAPLVADLDGLDGTARFSVGVDAAHAAEEVLVRGLPPLIAGIGPYAGAIVRGDGAIRLVLDVHALAPRARALGRVPEGRISEPPSRPPGSRRR